jgi:hypothetical protein
MSQRYYRPYVSDDENDTEFSSSDESDSDGTESVAELPQNRFHQFLAGSISLKTEEVRRKYENHTIPYSYVDFTTSGSAGEIVNTATLPKPKFETNKNTTLIMINSRDRDTSIYLQPTDFYIRLPRTYKNITNIAITELKLLSSFYYFSPTKSNTAISILELGRIRNESGVDISNVIVTNIRQGTYNANTLITELNLQLNSTPIFADISGGKGAFLARFQVSGNYAELFNQPGDNTYNSLTGTYDAGLTQAGVIAKYFYSATTNITNQVYTGDQANVAYYYPVLKEMVLDATQIGLLHLTDSDLLANNTTGGVEVSPNDSLNVTREQPFDRIVYGFRGLSDVYVTAVVNSPANQIVMDAYRQRNTYTYFLANKYICSYDTNAGRFNIVSPSINTSINSDLNIFYSNALIQQITTGSNTTNTFATLQASVINETAAVSDFYTFIHQNITNTFAIDFGKYTRKFFANLSNEISTYDASGVVSGFATQLSASIVGNQIDTSISLPADISGTWPLLVASQTNYMDYSSELPVDSNGYIDISNASEFVQGYVDIPINVNPLGYSQVKFKSRCRQTMSLMTLPRVQEQKVADLSEAYVLLPSMYNSQGICSFDPSSTANPTFYMYDISQSMFETTDSMISGNNYLNYLRQQKPLITNAIQKSDIYIPDNRSHIFFQLNTDKYLQTVDISNYMFDVKFRIDADVDKTFPTGMDVYMYRDRAAYMYDVSNSLTLVAAAYTPRPKNYFSITSSSVGASYLEINLRVLGNSTYYFYVRATANNYGSFIIKPYCILSSSYGTRYPVTNDIEFRNMPFPSTITHISPAIYKNKFYTYDLSANYVEGYDSNKVSSDYMDYLIRTTDNETGYDPNNGGYYSFKKINSSSSNIGSNITARDSNLWFYSNSSNYITFTSTTSLATYLSISNISSFKLAANESTTLKITNPFIACNVSNQETIILPRETLPAFSPSFIYTTVPFLSTVTNYPVTSTVTQSVPAYFSTAVAFQSTINLNFSSITNIFNASYDSNVNYRISKGNYPVVNTSPLYICDNPNTITYDCSYNPLPANQLQTTTNPYTFGIDASGVTGFTFQVPYDKFCSIQEIVMKFAYINPAITQPYLQNGINKPSIDLQYYNNKAIYLKIYQTTNIINKDPLAIAQLTPLMTLQRSKIVQIGSFTPAAAGQPATLRNRNPEWGTYYTYDICGSPPPLKPFPPFYKTDGTGILEPAPVANTYCAIPIDASGFVGAFYGLSFTKTCFNYKSTDPNLLVNYQVNYLLTKRNTPYEVPDSYQIQFLNQPTVPNGEPRYPPVHLIAKISYINPNTTYDPAQDISRFGDGTVAGISRELADTVMFLYDDSYSRDTTVIANDSRYGASRVLDATKTSTDDSIIWGQEKGTVYKAYDDDSGYNFLSYIHSSVIRQSNSNVLNIRGYVPTAQFATGLRLIGTNWTNFGVMTLNELIQDIDALVTGTLPMSIDTNGNIINEKKRYTGGNYFSRAYALALIRFNNAFKVRKIFGLGIGATSYLGYTFDGMSSANAFKAALTAYVTLYNSTIINQQTVNSASTKALTSLTNYVSIRYNGILPLSFLKRSRLSDPIPFQIQFKSPLKAPYLTAFDQWGLGWTLGFNKIDTAYSTQQTASTFIRITDDYIYLRMNEEMDMNTIDTSEKEYISQSQDTFGQSAKYFAKLLLNTFGNYTTTFVQSPKIFNPVLGKLDKLHFQLVNQFGSIINNNDCEFTVTLQVEESVDQLVKSGTLDTGTNQQTAVFSSDTK